MLVKNVLIGVVILAPQLQKKEYRLFVKTVHEIIIYLLFILTFIYLLSTQYFSF